MQGGEIWPLCHRVTDWVWKQGARGGMDWELLNGVTGLISAVCAIISVGYFSFHKESPYKTGSGLECSETGFIPRGLLRLGAVLFEFSMGL